MTMIAMQVIALVFLVILTLFAVSGMNTGVINLRTANNAQMMIEAEFAAQQQIEGVVSSFASFSSVATAPTVTNVDMNGDGECQANQHATGIQLYRLVDELADVRECFDG